MNQNNEFIKHYTMKVTDFIDFINFFKLSA
jgi:hypothetical protein